MKRKILDRLKGKLIVSCQAYEDNPLYGADNMLTIAKCAVQGGAEALRVCWPDQIKKIKDNLDVIIVGINKQFSEGMNLYDDVFITPSYESAKVLAEAGCDVIALDGTLRKRSYEQLEAIVKQLKAEFPDIVLMADISTLEEGIACERMGFDILSTTLSGYTRETMCENEEPDYEFIEQLKKHTNCYINAEGRIWDVSQLKRVKEMNPDSITIGSSITNPVKITQHFMKVMSENG